MSETNLLSHCKDEQKENLQGNAILFSRQDKWEGIIRKAIKGYIPHFHDFSEVDLEQYSLLIPLSYQAKRYFNQNYSFLNYRKAIVPSNEAINICNNKGRFNQFLVKNGFADVLPRVGEQLAYPYMLKKKVAGGMGDGIAVIRNFQDEQAFSNEISSADYFKQEYIEGREEYTTDVIMSKGKIVFMGTKEFLFNRDYFVKGKAFRPAGSRTVDHSFLVGLFESILNKLEYQGFCCFNYKLHRNEVRLFEINPRYEGTVNFFLNDAIAAYRAALSQ